MLIVFFFLIVLTAIKYVKNPFDGILVYVVVVLFCPYIILGSISFRIEFLLVPLLLIITLVRKRTQLIVTPVFIGWILFVIYIFFISFFNSSPVMESEINLIAFYNYLRYGALIIIGANLNIQIEDLKKYNRLFFYCSIPIALLSFGLLLDNGIASNITALFYTSPTRSVFVTQLNNIDFGIMFRSIGVFENVSYYATFLLIILTLGFTFILNKHEDYSLMNKWVFAFIMLLNIVAGISTSSLTFYAGFVILIVFSFIKFPVVTTKIFFVSSVGIYFSLILFFKNLLSSNQQYLDSFTYLYQTFIEGSKISERYALTSRENGDLDTLLGKSWIQGNGFRVFDKLVVNDSLYLEFFYEGGLIGVFLFCIFIGIVLFYTLRSSKVRSMQIFFVIIVLLVSGLGCNSLSIVRMSEWFWIMLGILSVKNHSKSNNLQFAIN